MNRVAFYEANKLRHELIQKAQSLGFETVGITHPNSLGNAASHLKTSLRSGWHGEMAWMQNNADRRSDPKSLWPPVQSIVVVGIGYALPYNPMLDLEHKNFGVVASYSRGDDYHNILKKKLKLLGRWISETYGNESRIFVDTAPVMEKPLANAAGIGWQGKHSNLVSRSWGNWLLLGTLFTDLQIEPDKPEIDHCGSCNACQDVCPTNAFVGPYQLDARRCISYLTIEFQGHIPLRFRSAIGNRIYGCDDCLAVCPWNKFAQLASEVSLRSRVELARPKLADLVLLDDSAFRELFRKSAIKRIGRARFVRNVLIAIGNSEDRSMLDLVKELLTDESPLVRAMAIWAISHLDERKNFIELRKKHIEKEEDNLVCIEWFTGEEKDD